MKNQPEHKLATISFVQSLGDTVDLWPTIESTDYAVANATGRERADAIIQYAADNQAPMVLGHVVAAIIGKGVYGAGEIGFFHRVAVHASATVKSDMGNIVPTEPKTRSTLRLVTSVD